VPESLIYRKFCFPAKISYALAPEWPIMLVETGLSYCPRGIATPHRC
jgi:hypothetical protein